MRLVGYLRVSTDRQADEGLGLDVQRDAIRRWAKTHGHRIARWCADEGVSGANGLSTREGLYDALEALEHNRADGLVVYSLDRLARKLTLQEGVLGEVWQRDGHVFSVTDGGEVLEDDPDDPIRTAIRQMRGVFAQLERGMIVKRMREGRERKRQQGGWAGFGSPPFGKRAENGELVDDPEEQEALALMRAMRGDGATLQEIADALTEAGYKPRQSRRPGTQRRNGDATTGAWNTGTISRILRREDRAA